MEKTKLKQFLKLFSHIKHSNLGISKIYLEDLISVEINAVPIVRRGENILKGIQNCLAVLIIQFLVFPRSVLRMYDIWKDKRVAFEWLVDWSIPKTVLISTMVRTYCNDSEQK